MKNFINSTILLFSIIILLNSCDRGPKPIEINNLEVKTDETRKFELKVPSNWINIVTPTKRIISFSNKESQNRFYKYDATGFPGAKIDLQVMSLDSANTFDMVIEKSKLFPAEYYSAPEKVNINGVSATKFTYTFELEDGSFDGVTYIATKDNEVATVINFETFANTNELYKDKFDEIFKSIKLAVNPPKRTADTTVQLVEAEPASTTLKNFSGQGFNIQIPDNFRAEVTKANGVIYSRNFTGDRRADCNIRVDVRDAKSTTLKKIAEENQSSIAGASKLNSTKLGGKEAYFLNYSANKDVKGRIFYVINDNKLLQISLTWFVGEEKDYLPTFEKSVNSINFSK